MRKSNNTMPEILKRIKTQRKALGFSYQDLEDRTGLSKSTLQRYETGDIKSIPLGKLDILAKALKVSTAYIMGWNDDDLSGKFVTINDKKEAYIINTYRKLNKEDQEKIATYCTDLMASIKYMEATITS